MNEQPLATYRNDVLRNIYYTHREFGVSPSGSMSANARLRQRATV